MADKLDLTGEIASAVDGAALRGHTLVLGYVDEEGDASLSFRGSTQVHSDHQLAFWARKTDAGVAKAIATRPRVTLLYYSPDRGPGPRYLSFHGTARVDPSASDAVYRQMIEGERSKDPDRGGVAIVVDIDAVSGFGADGPFRMERGA
jgi:hypothetical protein